MAKKLVCFLLVLACTCTASAEEAVFEMSVFGYTFGKLVVTKTQENDSTVRYTLNAKGKTNFLWMKREDETIYDVRYQNGKLVSSTHKQIETGVLKHWTNMVFDGVLLKIQSDKGVRSLISPPDYSVLRMYFEPLLQRSKVFHEAEGNYVNVVYKPDGTAEIKLSDGSRTVYKFEQGRIADMDIHLSIARVRITRVR